MQYNVIKIAEIDRRQLLVIIGQDGRPMLSIYNEHEGQTLMRMCEPTIDNLTRAVNILRDGE
jgi:hypothetical protein